MLDWKASSDDIIYACVQTHVIYLHIYRISTRIYSSQLSKQPPYHQKMSSSKSRSSSLYYSIPKITIMASSTSTTPTDLSQQIPLHNLLDTISPTIWYRLNVLLFDLQNFNHRQDSRERLDAVIDSTYIGAPYFTDEEATRIKQIAVTEKKTFEQTISEKLDERLSRRMQKRASSGYYRVCAAHDLTPIIADTLRVDLKQMERDKRFMHLVESKGLDLEGEQWDGLVKKSFAPGKSKKKRKKR